MDESSIEKDAIHYHFYLKSLDESWNTLEAIKYHSGQCEQLIGPAFIYALIKYSIPFKNSNSFPSGRYILTPEEFIDEENLALHQKIIDSRDKIFVHKDLEIYEPSYKNSQLAMNVIFETELIQEIDNVIKLNESVQDKILQKIEKSDH